MHLTNDDIERYQAHTMTPSEIQQFREHSDACQECRSKLDVEWGGAGALKALFSEEPDEQELVLFAAGRLTGERAAAIERHISDCEACAEAVADLRQFAVENRRPAARSTWVWGAIAATVVVTTSLGSMFLSQPAAPREVASLHDGARSIGWTASGEFRGLDGLNSEESGWIRDAVLSRRIALKPGLPQAEAGTLRGDYETQSFALGMPINRRVLSDRPEFRWEAPPGNWRFQVTVFDLNDQVVSQGETTAAQWQPASPLPRGQQLGWQVTARSGPIQLLVPKPPAPRIYFEIVSRDAANRIERAKGISPVSHLLLAVLYAREGLDTEAKEEMQVLAKSNDPSLLPRIVN